MFKTLFNVFCCRRKIICCSSRVMPTYMMPMELNMLKHDPQQFPYLSHSLDKSLIELIWGIVGQCLAHSVRPHSNSSYIVTKYSKHGIMYCIMEFMIYMIICIQEYKSVLIAKEDRQHIKM